LFIELSKPQLFRKTLAVALLPLSVPGLASTADLSLESCINAAVPALGTATAINEGN
jgi:hypothetical protein